MKIAVVYTGHLGNFDRCLAMIKSNIVSDPRITDWKLFFVLQSVQKNRMRYRIEDPSGNREVYVNGPIYDVKSMVGDHFGGLLVLDEDSELQKRLQTERKDFIDRTRNYSLWTEKICNYNKEMGCVFDHVADSIHSQFFYLKVGAEMVLKSGIEFDYCIRYRDRHAFKVVFNWDIPTRDTVTVLHSGSDCYRLELPLVAPPKLFCEFTTSFSDTVGKYRYPQSQIDYTLAHDYADITFTAEFQFARHIAENNISITEYPDLYWSNERASSNDGYGKSVIVQESDTEYEIELTLK